MIKKFSITTNMKNMTKNCTGLTLIELMVTLGAIAILVAIGLPRLSGMSSGNRMSATINTLAADLALARSEAINRNRTVTIARTGAQWTDGWSVDAPDAVGLGAVNISSRGPVPNGMTFTETIGNIQGVTYSSDGLKPDALTRRFVLCEVDRKNRILTINASGRYTTSTAGVVSASCP